MSAQTRASLVAVGLSALLSVGVAALVAGWIIAESVFPVGPGSAAGGSLVVSPPHHASRSLHGSHPRFAGTLSGPSAGGVTSASSATEPGSGRRGHCRLCHRVKATGLVKTLRVLAREAGHGEGKEHEGDHGNGHGHDKDKGKGNGHSASRPPSDGWLLRLVHHVRHRHHH